MKENFMIIFLLLKLIISADYYLSLESITSFNAKYDLDIKNMKEDLINNKMSYTGIIEDYEKILIDSKDNYLNIKKEKHPIVSITDSCSFENIEYFSTDTIFIIDTKCATNDIYLNYSDYIFYSLNMDDRYLKVLKKDKYLFVKIGKGPDSFINLFLGILYGFNLISSIISFQITKRKIKKLEFINRLPIYLFLKMLDFFIIYFNFFNIFLLFQKDSFFDIIYEYLFLLMKSYLKAFIYVIILLILQGWMTIDFLIVIKFKKYFITLFLYDLLIPVFFNLSLYFIVITSKLNFYFLKNGIEFFLIILFTIYCIKKKLIPLYKQINYERRKRSILVECLEFKYKKLFRIYLFLGIFFILMLIISFIEYQLIHVYFYDYYYHYIFFFLYALILDVFLNVIFYTKKLPLLYYFNIIFNYEEEFCLIADIAEHKNELNISNLTSKSLKKEKHPIVFINPFSSEKDKFLSNKISLGFVQKE